MGLTFANLQVSGKVEIRIDKLHICVNGNAKMAAPSLMNLPPMLSIPAAFEESISFNIFATLSTRTLENLKSLAGKTLFL